MSHVGKEKAKLLNRVRRLRGQLEAIERAIETVMAANPAQLADYRAGKEKLFGFFVGQVMKATAGKANPARLNELLKKKLGG